MARSDDLKLPDDLRDGVLQHIRQLGAAFEARGWSRRVGFGERAAVIVIDLARGWTDEGQWLGSNLDDVVVRTRDVLDAARTAGLPIFFTVQGYAPDDPGSPLDAKYTDYRGALALGTAATELDSRLGRRDTEKLIVKKYPSCFKGTDLNEMLQALRIDTLIVTGCSTLHCVYATCREASGSFHVIVPREAVGDRCDLFHEVALLDIDAGMGDVMPVADVIAHIAGRSADV